MPLPKPEDGESQSDFMGRCVPEAMSGDMEQDQAVAACMTQWNDSRAASTEIVQKTTIAPPPNGDALEFIMSDASIDRMGDVIEADGWQLDNFKRNPIALFGHQSGFPIGKWRDVQVVNGALRGRLELMPAVSDRLREVHAAIQGGVLRAVSVGFHALEAQPLEGSKVGGLRYLKSELVECSVVSVPANPNALALARSLNLSRGTQALIFGKIANESQDQSLGKPPGKLAADHRELRTKTMNLSERIEQTQAKIVSLRDQLTEHLGKDDDGTDEAAMVVAEELNATIEATQRQLEMLKRAESTLAAHSEPVITTAVPPGAGGQQRARPFAVPKKDIKPGDYVFRSLAVAALSHITKRPIETVLRERYGEDEPTRVVTDAVIQRAASVPASTTLSHWASELVQTSIGDFLDTLMPQSVYPGLSARGTRFSFDRNGTITIPARDRTPTIAGAFVAEGAAIPVKQGALSSVSLTPRTMGVISTFTRRLAQHSTPSIEGIIRQAMQEDTAVALDTILLDSTVGDATRPPGLLYGVGATSATSGGGFTALVGDIKNLVGVLVAANSLRAPVWIMNPARVLAISLTQNAGGDFPFAAEVNGGTLQNYPIIQSTTVTSTTVILLDAADFFSATGDAPQFEVSDQAVLHMEDSAPQAIGVAGSATLPIRSLWQTDSIGIRMLLDISWVMRRTGVVAYSTSVTW